MSPSKLTSESTAASEATDTYLGSNRAVCFELDGISHCQLITLLNSQFYILHFDSEFGDLSWKVPGQDTVVCLNSTVPRPSQLRLMGSPAIDSCLLAIRTSIDLEAMLYIAPMMAALLISRRCHLLIAFTRIGAPLPPVSVSGRSQSRIPRQSVWTPRSPAEKNSFVRVNFFQMVRLLGYHVGGAVVHSTSIVFSIVFSACFSWLFLSIIFFISAYARQQLTVGPEPQSGIILLFIHVSQRWCILLVPPQTGHLHKLLTSLSAFPAICLCLFLACDVFFFGTAFKMPSQITSSMSGMEGRFRDMAGMASEYLGRNGSDICLV